MLISYIIALFCSIGCPNIKIPSTTLPVNPLPLSRTRPSSSKCSKRRALKSFSSSIPSTNMLSLKEFRGRQVVCVSGEGLELGEEGLRGALGGKGCRISESIWLLIQQVWSFHSFH